MLKILEINSYSMGSTGRIMNEIAALARNHGFQVVTATPMSRTNMKHIPSNHLWIGNILTRQFHLKAAWLTGLNGCFSAISTLVFLRKVDEYQPDVIHLHNLHNCYINLPLLFRYIKKRQIKVFWTLHDCWAFTGQCPHFQIAQCDKWKTCCGACPQIREYPAALVDQTKAMWKMKRSWFTDVKDLTIIAPSYWLAGLVKESFLNEYSVKVIHNGIDLNVFHPIDSGFRNTHGIGENQYVVLGVAFEWSRKKGLDVFIELSKRLPESYQIVLVGTNDLIDAQLPDNIIAIHKTQNQKELAEIYTAADVFINPTREEVFGLVNAEALACGTPVITFRSGGSVEIPDQTCGCIVDLNDVSGMERQIIRVCEERPFSAEACIQRAMKFDINEKFREYIALYKESDK